MNLPPIAVQAGRRILGWQVPSRARYRGGVAGKFGLEIGGPSIVFGDSGELPLYRYVAGLDNCNFAFETVWEGKQVEGETYFYHPRRPNGSNFVREATDLRGIPNHKYDFILSCHNLEHISNPVRALREWMRVIKPGGTIVILLPDYRHTFDHRRTPTPVEHMLEDYRLQTDETDLTHLDEILELHDLSRDLAAGSKEQFRARSRQNFANRCLHHHVFDERNSRALCEAVGLEVKLAEVAKPQHIAILAQSPLVGKDRNPS